MIRFTKCTKLYIGETGRTLNTHFKEHLADIKYHSHRDKSIANISPRLVTPLQLR